MNGTALVGFLCIVGIGSYLQAFSGFALGIFVLGAVVMLQLVSLETTAIAINIMMVVNTGVALHGNVHRMNQKLFARTMIGIIPGVPVGLWLLDTLSARSTQLLQFTLGVVVLLTGALLFAMLVVFSAGIGEQVTWPLLVGAAVVVVVSTALYVRDGWRQVAAV